MFDAPINRKYHTILMVGRVPTFAIWRDEVPSLPPQACTYNATSSAGGTWRFSGDWWIETISMSESFEKIQYPIPSMYDLFVIHLGSFLGVNERIMILEPYPY